MTKEWIRDKILFNLENRFTGVAPWCQIARYLGYWGDPLYPCDSCQWTVEDHALIEEVMAELINAGTIWRRDIPWYNREDGAAETWCGLMSDNVDETELAARRNAILRPDRKAISIASIERECFYDAYDPDTIPIRMPLYFKLVEEGFIRIAVCEETVIRFGENVASRELIVVRTSLDDMTVAALQSPRPIERRRFPKALAHMAADCKLHTRWASERIGAEAGIHCEQYSYTTIGIPALRGIADSLIKEGQTLKALADALDAQPVLPWV